MIHSVLLCVFFAIAIAAVSSSKLAVSSTRVFSSDRSESLRKLGADAKNSRGLERCLQDKLFSERVEIGTQCVCKNKASDNANDDDEGIVLVCSDECAFCNEERTVCGIKSEEALYDIKSGLKIGMGQVFEYLKFGPMTRVLPTEQQSQAGDGIILGIEELDCNEEKIDNEYEMGRCSRCNVYFGGTKCNLCEVTECGNTGSGIFAPIMDCTNIQENAVFDFCSDSIAMDENSFFQAFLPDEFNKCLPMDNLLGE